MKRIILYLLISIPCFLFAQVAKDSIFLPSIEKKKPTIKEVANKIKFSSYLGATSSFPVGKYIATEKDRVKNLNEKSNEINFYKAHFIPRTSFHVGFLVSYPLRAKWDINLGLLYSQRGYSFAENIQYHHPDYQYDELLTNKVKQRINALDFTISTTYKWKKHLYFYGGANIGSNIFNKYNAIHQTLQMDVMINKELDDIKSYPLTKTKIVPDFRKTSFSFIGGLQIPFSKRYSINIFSQYTNNIIKQVKYQSLSANLGLIYCFSN